VTRNNSQIRAHPASHEIPRAVLGLCLAIAISSLGGLVAAGDALAADVFTFAPVKFEILDPETREIIGYGGYRAEQGDGTIVVSGESRFLNGDYDSEVSKMKIVAGRPLPVLIEFEHVFYNPDGSIFSLARVNFATGAASCTSHKGGSETVRKDNLESSSDTYAGATIIIAIQRYAREREPEPFRINAFNCAPGPRVLPLEVSTGEPDRWPYGNALAVRTDVVPRFGWWDIVIRPFLPPLNVWFDPRRGWTFVGATLARYYRGPQIALVAVPAGRSSGRADR
jgi:hypothetical protein